MHEIVKQYYGKELRSSGDLKTTACCDPSATPAALWPLLGKIHSRILERYYGCGFVCPPLLEGARVLDLGCGAGRDVYLLSQLVGKTGEVIGVDMTDEQLAIAEAYRSYHAEAFGFANASFRSGYIERLDELDLEAGSFDLVVSNCVVNLSPDKLAVLGGVNLLLKPGGEFYFSDVYADRRVPDRLAMDPVIYGECLGGALYWNDFVRTAREAGFADPRLVEDRPLKITDPAISGRLGAVGFHAATYRLFKLDGLETDCEDYGQAVTYRGSILDQPDRFALDKHHILETGRTLPVCGNTWRMLRETRYAPHFDFTGDFSCHFGLFEGCGSSLPFDRVQDGTAGSCC